MMQTVSQETQARPRITLRTQPPTREERARLRDEVAARREQATTRRGDAALERMLSASLQIPRRGRPAMVLYPQVAERALLELEEYGLSYSVVATRCGRKKPWLVAAYHSGRLQLMAEGRMGQPTGP